MNKFLQDYLREHQKESLVGAQQGLLLRAGVYTPDGKLAEEVIQPAHSYVRYWPELLNIHLGMRNGTDTVIDVDGVSRSISTSTGLNTFPRVNAAVAAGTYGIVVGTGTAAVAMTDVALGTKIAHGTGSGQLSHGLCATYPVDTTGANTARYINIARGFQNNSGAAVTVSEAGVYVADNRVPGDGIFCACRDLITFTIPIGYLAVVQYQMVFNLT